MRRTQPLPRVWFSPDCLAKRQRHSLKRALETKTMVALDFKSFVWSHCRESV
jgi:hypothetical protein